MEHSVVFNSILIAPCGINCGTCIAYLRPKNKCPGCRVIKDDKSKSRLACIIKNCEQLPATSSAFCISCNRFPCKRMKQLDKRYSTRYHTSLIQNLRTLNEMGMTDYLSSESIKWACPSCGATISIHREHCLACKTDLRKQPLVKTS
jgi:rubredoxin